MTGQADSTTTQVSPADPPDVTARAAEAAAEPTEDTLSAGAMGRRRYRRIAVAAAFILVVVCTALVLIALALTQERPRWWVRVDPTSPETIATAEKVENGLASALTQVRETNMRAAIEPGTEQADIAAWKIFVTTEQANAWLNVRLRRWLADQAEQGAIDFQWPAEIGQMQVSFQQGLIHVGAVVTRAPAPGAAPRAQTFAAALRPQFSDDGALWMTAERIEIGRLPLPAGWVLGSASGTEKKLADVSSALASQPQTQRVLAAFRGERPVLSRPSVKLADGRRVRIIGVEPGNDRLTITCTTEQTGAGSR